MCRRATEGPRRCHVLAGFPRPLSLRSLLESGRFTRVNFTGNGESQSRQRQDEGNPGVLEVEWPAGGPTNRDKELGPDILVCVTYWS